VGLVVTIINKKQPVAPAVAMRHCRACDADFPADAEHWYTFGKGAQIHRQCPERTRRSKVGRAGGSSLHALWTRAESAAGTSDRAELTRLGLEALLREHGIDLARDAAQRHAAKVERLLAGLSPDQREAVLQALRNGAT
jgi:hypothetical protein